MEDRKNRRRRVFALQSSDHAAYLTGWLKVLKADKKAVFTAASAASKAAAWLARLAAAERERMVA